jgi:hypothetical protein
MRNLFTLFVCVHLSIPTKVQASLSSLIFQSDKAEIVLKDYLHHPLFWWPNTLLSYSIVFDEDIAINHLILVDKETSKQIPFQLAGVHKNAEGKNEATLYIISDLPSGGERTFVLKKGTPEKFSNIEVSKNDRLYTVQTDVLKIEFPVSQTNRQGSVPGPVLSVCPFGKKEMGISSFNTGNKQVDKLEVAVVSQGVLFVEIELKYFFNGGSTYQANVRCVKGYDFFEIKEQMEGFTSQENVNWEILWNNFSPTHRQAPNHPYGGPGDLPGFNRFNWERVDQSTLNSHHGIMYSPGNGKIPFEVGIYGNWPAERNVTSTVFWDEKEMQSIGAFTKDIAYWDDREYSIWASSGLLNIKFYYVDNNLKWIYPVCNGKRSTAISCYSHQSDVNYMEELERMEVLKVIPRGRISQLSYNTFLQNRHSTIDLDKVKDWDLTCPEPLSVQKIIFNKESGINIQSLERHFFYGGYSNELAVSGPCQNSGYSPSPAGSFHHTYVSLYNQLLPEMTPEQRARLSAMFLMHAYVAASEEYMPMRVMLSGHPNFLAEIRSIPAFAAFLFPQHREAKNWSNMFAKYIELNTHYHCRPDVMKWDAEGGRWTENLSCYTWGFLKATIRANYLVRTYGNGTNPMATNNMAKLGTWILNSLSAPYDGESLDFYRNKEGKIPQHYWGIVTKEDGPRRVQPPQGAHAGRHKPASALWLIGDFLQYYSPLLAENIRFVTSPQDEDFESAERPNAFSFMYPQKDYDTGTPPDFKSVKFTGYGIVLRAAVGTKDELSIHLTQIDNGPNYRWGVPAQGGCGNIYFYAAGKSYSHNGSEDSGDRKVQDVDLITNCGAFKDGCFRSIGMNELERPLYDLSIGQFAEITSSKKTGYSWPEYQSRSIMLVRNDYFIVYDDIFNNNIGTRFSWFTHLMENLPEITVIKSAGLGFDHIKWNVEKTEHIGKWSKGVWYDGMGDMMTFVSHKKGFNIVPVFYGCIITSKEGAKDYIFRNDIPVEVDENGCLFTGTAGFIRSWNADRQEMSLFHGTKIGNRDFEIHTPDQDAGINAIYTGINNIKGEFYSLAASNITFRWTHVIPQSVNFFLDGQKLPVSINGNEMTVKFPAGKHIWNISNGLPILPRPEIESTRHENESALLIISQVPGAQQYRYEYSLNADKNWTTIAKQTKNSIRVKPVNNERKGFVRVFAVNNEYESESSIIYPVYFTDEKPHYPEGLKLVRGIGSVSVTWGQVLGCTEYRLYRRTKGSNPYKLIYKGEKNKFNDRLDNKTVYEYMVSAVNGIGESLYSPLVDNDPNSWLNFNPIPDEPFRRAGSRSIGVDNTGNPVETYYPK